MKLGTDYEHMTHFESGRTAIGQETSRTGRAHRVLKVEVGGRPLHSVSRKQRARARSSGEAEFDAAASATSDAMLI